MEYRKLTRKEYKDLENRILYEDNHILAVNKNCGELVQGDKSGDEPIGEKYKAFIAERDNKPGKVFIGVPHRLDRPVSGIILLAKTSKALSRMTELFRKDQVKKVYLALTCDAPKNKEGKLTGYMFKNEKNNKSYILKNKPNNKKTKFAELNYKYIDKTERYHLIEVELITGRHHQIRCQLSNMGCKIKGDLKYGAPRSNKDGGICLHSTYTSFIHPIKKEKMNIVAPIPTSWKGVNINIQKLFQVLP